MGEAALAVHTAKNGRNHPWTKDSARVTADALGRAEEATALRERYGSAFLCSLALTFDQPLATAVFTALTCGTAVIIIRRRSR